MSKHRPLVYGQPVPQSFFDAWQEFVSTMTANLTLSIVPPAGANPPIAVRIVAGPDNAQVGIGINGRWRYITSTVTATVGPTAGTYDLFVTASANQFVSNPTPPPPENDQTNYGFALAAVARGQNPIQPHFRKVGEAVFDGTRITSLRQMVGQIDSSGTFVAGDMKASFAVSPPAGWLRCDGAQYLISDYPELFGAIGYAYGGTGANFRVPDLRNRFPMGAETAIAVGQVGGAAAVALSLAQLPAHDHGAQTSTTTDHTHSVSGTTRQNSVAHTHSFFNPAGTFGQSVAMWQAGITAGFSGVNQTTGSESAPHTHEFSVTSGSAGGSHRHTITSQGAGEAHENRPPFVALAFFIKA